MLINLLKLVPWPIYALIVVLAALLTLGIALADRKNPLMRGKK
jgi:predicted amidohydrolase